MFYKNEDILRTCIEDLQEKLKKQEEKFSALKEQAENKLAKCVIVSYIIKLGAT